MVRDLRLALRLFAKDPVFTVGVVLVLSIALAASNTVVTVANAIAVRTLPVAHADRIVHLSTHDEKHPSRGVSYPDYVDWRTSSRSFDGMAAFSDALMLIGDEGRAPDRLAGTFISAHAFNLLGTSPALGRGFLAEDDRPGAPPVVILGQEVWRSRYNGDAGIVGRSIRVDEQPATVIGVMGEGFKFPFNAELWRPLSALPGLAAATRDARTLGVVGRLAPGRSIADARAELTPLADRLARDFPTTNSDVRPHVTTFNEHYNGGLGPILTALVAAVAFVLLIACAHVASLLLTRSSYRAREISVRVMLGASRLGIVRQLLAESLLLASIAGLIGLGLSLLAIRLLSDSVEGLTKPYWLDFTMDVNTFAFFVVVCLGTGIVFGLAPAWHTSRTDAEAVLKSGSRGSSRAGLRRWTSVLLVAEFALTLVLLTGAGLLTRSVLALNRADLVIDLSNVVAMQLALPPHKFATPEQRLALYDRVEARLASSSALSAATVASAMPFIPVRPRRLTIEGRPVAHARTAPAVAVVSVGPRYFATLGLGLVRGRTFTDADGTPGRLAAIVNQRFASLFFPAGSPIGQRIALGAPTAAADPQWLTIVGVSPSVRQNMGAAPNPVVYVPRRTEPAPSATLLVRGPTNANALIALIREEVRLVDPELPLYSPRTLEQVLSQTLWPRRAFSVLFVVFAVIGLVLSGVGLFAVTAYTVSQRTREFGIRMALGAPQSHVWRLVLRGTFVPLLVSVFLGGAGAVGMGTLLKAWLIQTPAVDPLVFAATVLSLVAVIAVASAWPARRATQLDPAQTLRTE